MVRYDPLPPSASDAREAYMRSVGLDPLTAAARQQSPVDVLREIALQGTTRTPLSSPPLLPINNPGPNAWPGQINQALEAGVNPMTSFNITKQQGAGWVPPAEIWAPSDPMVPSTRGGTATQDGTRGVYNPIDVIKNALKQKAAEQGKKQGRDKANVLKGRNYSLEGDEGAQQSEDLFKTAYARRLAQYNADVEAQLGEISDRYGDRIRQLQEELAGYRGGLAGVNRAYSDYADDADKILSEAAAVQAEALPESAVAAEVDRTYAEFGGVMAETLAKIDTNGNPALAEAMAAEVTRTQEYVADGLRSQLMSQTEMHALAGQQAQALAHMAWKDDAYAAEKNRFTLELEINKAISDKADQLQATKDEMNAAIAAARASMADFEMTPDELWDAAMSDYAASQGLNAYEVQELKATWTALMGMPGSQQNYNTFKQNLQLGVNLEALAQVGLSDEVAQIQAILGQAEDPAHLERFNTLLQTQGLEQLVTEIQVQLGEMGLVGSYDPDVDFASAASMADKQYQTMLDLWSHYGDFKTNYEEYVNAARSIANVSKGSSAPQNWNNRYQPEYRHRREVWAQQFADLFKSAFAGVDGIAVGGLGYMRKPTDVGNGRAKNSDHQSGGALDLYAASHEDMLKIEAWARSQPGVSYVIYSGNKYHEGHHVHVSLQLGYGYGG